MKELLEKASKKRQRLKKEISHKAIFATPIDFNVVWIIIVLAPQYLLHFISLPY